MKTRIRSIVLLSIVAFMVGCGGTGGAGNPGNTPTQEESQFTKTIFISHGYGEGMCIDLANETQEGMDSMHETTEKIRPVVVEYEVQPNSITCGDYGLANLVTDPDAATENPSTVCYDAEYDFGLANEACVIITTIDTNQATAEEVNGVMTIAISDAS